MGIKTISIAFVKMIAYFDDIHPYFTSFLISVALTGFILFYSAGMDDVFIDNDRTDTLQFIDIKEMQAEAPQRVVKKEITTEVDAETAVVEKQVDRAEGVSDDENALDLAFYPNIAPPKLIGNLNKLFPRSARDLQVEATVHVELLIDSDGIVRQVNVIAVRLSKSLPEESMKTIEGDFARDAVTMLHGQRFTPPVVEGRRVPVRLTLPLRFELT